jgi:hypothetical protein
MNNWRENLTEVPRPPGKKERLTGGNLAELNKHALKALKSGDTLVITELDKLTKSVHELKLEQFKENR